MCYSWVHFIRFRIDRFNDAECDRNFAFLCRGNCEVNDSGKPTNLAPLLILGFLVVFLAISFLVTVVQYKREKHNVAKTRLFTVPSNNIVADSELMEDGSTFDHSLII